MISNVGWKCYKCGTVHPSYIEKCFKCGNTKQANDAREQEIKEKPIDQENADSELLNLQKLKAYKDLLDSGVISQKSLIRKKLNYYKRRIDKGRGTWIYQAPRPF